MFKDYDVHHVQILGERMEDLNFWLTKFVQEVANKMGGRYPPRSLYGSVSGLKRHVEDENGWKALNPLVMRYFSSSCALVQRVLHNIESL